MELKWVQDIVRTLLYYSQAVDPTLGGGNRGSMSPTVRLCCNTSKCNCPFPGKQYNPHRALGCLISVQIKRTKQSDKTFLLDKTG
eukprot:13867277-Ditylum_brightwellii.AAC.1